MFGFGWSYVEIYLICHVTSQDYVTEGSCDIMGGNPSWSVTTLPTLVAISIMIVEMFLICHVILQDHEI